MAGAPIDERVPCLNPRCRRTAPRDKYGDSMEIVCGKCWKLLPQAVRDRYRALRRRERRLLRRIDRLVARKAISGAQVERLRDGMSRACNRNWHDIRSCFLAPARPIGLDAFLEEAGL